MTINLILQYTAVAVLMIAALIWLIVKSRRTRRKGGGSCCGCSMSQHCRNSEHPHHRNPNQTESEAAKHTCPGKKDCCR